MDGHERISQEDQHHLPSWICGINDDLHTRRAGIYRLDGAARGQVVYGTGDQSLDGAGAEYRALVERKDESCVKRL
jgi:hypothetical protein